MNTIIARRRSKQCQMRQISIFLDAPLGSLSSRVLIVSSWGAPVEEKKKPEADIAHDLQFPDRLNRSFEYQKKKRPNQEEKASSNGRR